jgi:PAS domain S-box-containing protein
MGWSLLRLGRHGLLRASERAGRVSGDSDFDGPMGRDSRQSVPSGPRATAWVLEDSAQQAQAIQAALSPLLDARLFQDSAQFLEALASSQPNVLILDWHLPQISGLEVLEVVRQRHDEVTLPALILTASQADRAVEALEAGANDYASKPFVAAELRARVSTLVRVQGLHARARRAERERAEALAQKESGEAQLRLMTDTIPLLVSFVTPDETYGFANRAYEEWFGISSQDLVGRKVRDVIGEAAYSVLGPYVKRGLSGERFSFEQHGVPYRAGGKRDVRVTFVPLTLAGQSRSGYLALLEDITSERELQVEREKLARERVDAFERQAQFEQQLIGIVSHDLRTPLNVITLSAVLIQRADGLSASVQKNVARIRKSADRAVRMVADLLDFTQARLGGGLRVERRDTNVHPLIDALVTELEAAFPGRRIAHTHEGSGRGEWDAERLSQLMQNLITNALKYSPAESTVEVSSETSEVSLTLRVHNDGDPIPADKIALLFEPLQRGVEQIDRVTRSVGLGLYIVQKIAEAHDGSVEVESTAELGTTFAVVLPLVRTRTRQPSPPHS